MTEEELKMAKNNHCPECGVWLHYNMIETDGFCEVHGWFELDVEV